MEGSTLKLLMFKNASTREGRCTNVEETHTRGEIIRKLR